MNRPQHEDPILKSLETEHLKVNARHEESRAQLLESLSVATPAVRATDSTSAWRYVFGGLGVGAVASAVVLGFWLLVPISPAMAMERMASALDRVTTYSFRMESVYVSREGKGRTVRQVQLGRLRTEPVGLHARVHIVETLDTNTAVPGEPKTLVDLEETHRSGRPGIIIDHAKNEFWRIEEQIDANSIPSASSQVLIYMVRQRRGRVLRDLGEKKIEGIVARGLEIQLDDADLQSDLGPVSAESDDAQDAGWEWRGVNVQVWLDPKTYLPIEFRCTRHGDDFETTYRFSDLKWNVQFAEDAFDTTPPSGYSQLDDSPWAEQE